MWEEEGGQGGMHVLCRFASFTGQVSFEIENLQLLLARALQSTSLLSTASDTWARPPPPTLVTIPTSVTKDSETKRMQHANTEEWRRMTWLRASPPIYPGANCLESNTRARAHTHSRTPARSHARAHN